MKKIIAGIFLLSILGTSLYAQEISEKEGMKVLEEIRREIKAEERAKQKAAEDAKRAEEEAEKARIAAAKEEERKGKKIIEDIRRNQNESLEEKVFRSENTPEARMAAAKEALKIGKDRMVFLREEEEEIIKLEEAIGINSNEKREFLSQKYDEVYDEFESNSCEIKLLLHENEKLNEYLSRLDKMEQKIRIGN
ncbi:hypothetical protein [Fusobacterium sp. THCT1E2]